MILGEQKANINCSWGISLPLGVFPQAQRGRGVEKKHAPVGRARAFVPAMAKSRILLAILGVMFLLLNPAGVCPASHSHPCCPPPAGSHQQQSGGSCVCIDRQPAAPVLPPLMDAGVVAPQAVVAPTVALDTERITPPDPPPSDERSFLTFHQILV